MKENKNSVKRRYILSILFILFAAPGLFAYFFYKNPQWLSSNTTNQGLLLRQPLKVERLLYPKVKIHSQQETIAPQWQLFLWSPDGCEKNCMQKIDQLTRVRLALGRHLYAVAVHLCMPSEAESLSDTYLKILRDHDVHVTTLSSRETASIQRGLNFKPHQSQIFIANPEAFIVLAYPVQVNLAAIFHDLKHLVTQKSNAV